LVKSYCDQLGWNIGIASNQEGTKVTLHLKLARIDDTYKEDNPKVDTGNRDRGDKPKLLIVEDNAELADFLVNALQTTYDCSIVGDGRQALHLIDGHTFMPDIVITD